jgi:hypothetical protein
MRFTGIYSTLQHFTSRGIEADFELKQTGTFAVTANGREKPMLLKRASSFPSALILAGSILSVTACGQRLSDPSAGHDLTSMATTAGNSATAKETEVADRHVSDPANRIRFETARASLDQVPLPGMYSQSVFGVIRRGSNPLILDGTLVITITRKIHNLRLQPATPSTWLAEPRRNVTSL